VIRLLPLLMVGVLAAVAAPSAIAQVHVQCLTPSSSTSCDGWHTTDVSVEWAVVPPFVATSGCSPAFITYDTRGEAHTCTAVAGAQQISRRVTIQVDRTPPFVTGAAPSRPPDSSGWYRGPVGVTFAGTDATSGIAGCTAPTYSGPDSRSAAVAGVCRDVAGNTSQRSFNLRYDATPPVVSAIRPARPPDYGSWYTQPIGFSVSGSDRMSGLAGCDPAAYGGPASAAAVVTGTCRDQAGNVGSRALSVPFDATPPALRKVRVRPGDRVVRLNWRRIDATAVEVVRIPGREGEPHTLLYSGSEKSLVDHPVRNGRPFEYTFKAIDQAGNVATRTIRVVPGPRLVAPRSRARLTDPPVLRWTPVEGARYYNVQLFRGDRKVLSAWPTRPRLALRQRWQYYGDQRLQRGRYRWIVWPGEGRRSQREYGPAIGRRTFVIAPST
jgi:hypothetical protein